MKSVLNTKTYKINDAFTGAIRRQSFSRRFIVADVTVIAIVFFVNADFIVVALIVSVIFFPCIMRLPPAIPEVSVEKRVSRRGRRRGHIAVVLTKMGLQHQQIKGIFARVGEEPCPDVNIFIYKDELRERQGIRGSPA